MTADAGATRLQRRRARSDEVVRRYLLIAVPAHVVLGVVLRWSSIASTVYVGATLLVALFVVLTARDIDGVTIAVAYIVATEVLWRMTRAHFFFEGGKYAMVALLVIASFRFFPGWRAAIVPAVYLASFAVSAVLSLRYFGASSRLASPSASAWRGRSAWPSRCGSFRRRARQSGDFGWPCGRWCCPWSRSQPSP
jgi:hypothetical protein